MNLTAEQVRVLRAYAVEDGSQYVSRTVLNREMGFIVVRQVSMELLRLGYVDDFKTITATGRRALLGVEGVRRVDGHQTED